MGRLAVPSSDNELPDRRHIKRARVRVGSAAIVCSTTRSMPSCGCSIGLAVIAFITHGRAGRDIGSEVEQNLKLGCRSPGPR